MKVGEVIARVAVDDEASTDSDDVASEQSDRAASTEADGKATDVDSQTAEKKKSDEASQEPVAAQEMEAGRAPQAPISEQERQREITPAQKDSERPPAPAAPSIRRLARELGVDIHDVSGSGPGGRINEDDVKETVRKQNTGAAGPIAGGTAHEMGEFPDFSRWGQVDIEKMETVRRLTAQSTAASWTIIPHVTQFDEADITAVMAFIEKNAKKVEKAGAKLTVTAILTRVCAEALRRFPRFNASIDTAANRIIIKRYVHIGIAADTPRGLLVPVIRDADQKSIVDLAKAIADLAQRARNKKIKPDELEGGTFSISNQGGIGGVAFTPIVLWPQVAILGVSRSAVKPVYVADRLEPRTLLPLSLSYDHRMIDGADAARFLRWICDGLEQPMTLFLD